MTATPLQGTVPTSDLDDFDAIDREIVSIARSIRVLSHLTWPAALRDEFLDGWRRGNPILPRAELRPVDHSREIEALTEVAKRCPEDHPLGDHLRRTAACYITVCRMLGSIGTPGFAEQSIALYGRPGHVYEGQGLSAATAAERLLAVSGDLVRSHTILPAPADMTAEDFADRLREELGGFFTEDRVEVVVDPTMSAKAAAGSKRVRVQAGAMFSEFDLAQLLNHEAFIHTATSLNGKHQPHLRVLGLGSPRTTKTQEGLAVFSELVTYSIDLARLRRVALRAIAVEAALEGADFIDVFEIYLNGGQSPEDAYNSAQRVFRGGEVRGGIAFTKDGVYLEGLLLVQTFLRKAIADDRPDLIPILFSGRMTLGDAIHLRPLFRDGTLQRAVYLPSWLARLQRLSAQLTYSLVSAQIHLDHVQLEQFASTPQNGAP